MVTWTIELLNRLRLVNIRLQCIYKNYKLGFTVKFNREAG